jgi:cytochrome b pre-mRNA-processing protein 3
MSIASLFRRTSHRDAAMILYEKIVEQARLPVFFGTYGVPDTLDGRFDLILLHGFLVLNRLKTERPRTAAFAQQLFDVMFTDVDRGLREMGVGDLSVGRHVKAMAQAFYGRIRSYETGIGEGGATLIEALRRNLYGTVSPQDPHVAVLADYVRRSAALLAAQPVDELLAGAVAFAPPPGTDGAAP